MTTQEELKVCTNCDSNMQTIFIVISGDLIVNEKFLHSMADLHRLEDSIVTALISRPQTEEGNYYHLCLDLF